MNSPDKTARKGAKMSDTISAAQVAYREGYLQNELGANPHGNRVTAVMNLAECREAVRNWREAATDHAHASYWGAAHIRVMRAYWLGAARGKIHAAIYAAQVDRVESLARDEGKSAATWYRVDSSAVARQTLADLDNCEADYLPRADFSGQWADGDTVAAMLDRAGVDVDDEAEPETADELADVYRDTFNDSAELAIVKECREYLAAIVPLDRDARYSVDGFGAAVYVTDQPTADSVTVVMVGDDSPHTVDRDQLTLIGEDDYCAECGQIGCTADGRARGEDGNATVAILAPIGAAIAGLMILAPIGAEIIGAIHKVAAILAV